MLVSNGTLMFCSTKCPGRLSEDVDVVSWFGLMTAGGFTLGILTGIGGEIVTRDRAWH